MAYLETIFIEGSTGAVLDSAAGTPNSQALTIQGNASGVPIPVSGTLTSTILGVAAVSGVVGATQAGTFAVASTQGGSWAISATQGTLPWVTTATIIGTPAVTATLSGISAISGVVGATQAGAFAVSSTQGGSWAVSATQGTSPWVTTSTIQGTTAVQGVVGATQGGSWAVAATQGTSPWVCTATISGTAAENLLAVGGILLGTTAVTLFGSTPAASTVPGVNAFVTNVVTTTQANQAVTQGGVFAVAATQGGVYAVAATQAGAFAVASTQAGAFAVSATQVGAFSVAATQGGTYAVAATIVSGTLSTITNPVPVNVAGHIGGIVDAVATITTAPANGWLSLAMCGTTVPVLTTAQSIAAQCDYSGNLFIRPFRRGQTIVGSIAALNTTSTQTLISTGAAGQYRDLTQLVISPVPSVKATGGATAAVILSDGTNSYTFNIQTGVSVSTAGQSYPAIGYSISFNPPLPQATTATMWTVTQNVTGATCSVTAVAVIQQPS